MVIIHMSMELKLARLGEVLVEQELDLNMFCCRLSDWQSIKVTKTFCVHLHCTVKYIPLLRLMEMLFVTTV